MKEKFKTQDWLRMETVGSAQNQTTNQSPNLSASNGPDSVSSEINLIISRIEASAIDIAPNYADWRDLGFALADTLGESGRQYYHRLSRFYSKYTETETNKQFDNCLKAHGHGVTIKTLYHLAKAAGINIATSKAIQSPNTETKLSPSPIGEGSEVRSETVDMEETQIALPTFPDEVYTDLPHLLQLVIEKAISAEDKDLLLLGSLVVISACLPNIFGIYAERTVFPNLFLFLTAQASAGKGRLTLCRKLVEPIHRKLREQAKAAYVEYQCKLTEYAAAKNKSEVERPIEPPMRMLIIPANNSSTGLFQLLNDNQGIGLIFETEGDTLALTFKSEHGNYSDGFRKAFHHETISYNRRKDREFVELETPRLSALLSGTPKQVSTLIPNAENGLFSRFIFYFLNVRPIWNDVFAGNSDQTLDSYFNHLGNQFHDLYKFLQSSSEPMRFCLTSGQQQDFNAYFSQTQNQYLYLCGLDYLATVRRLGLITFRIAMILTALRIMDNGELQSPLVCSDTDFNTALSMVKILVQHAAQVYQQLPTEAVSKVPVNQKQQFLDELPPEFSRKDYLAAAQKLGIPDKTAEKHIKRFAVNGLINHFAHDKYKKP
ncbi:MAG: DUF3987 domain-containing protein [Prolixibacteraceae bacterium]|nr:DUF3987 domain-containing protein [Prolixibacteraceae bacterium]